MEATRDIEIQEGADVRSNEGDRLGVVEEIRTDSVSGQQTSFVMKSGFWIFGKNRILSTDTVERVEDGAIVVGISKDELRGIPEIDA